MMRLPASVLCLLAALACGPGASPPAPSGTGPPGGVNNPLVQITVSAFTFVLKAQAFSYNQTFGPTMRGDSIAMSITVSNFAGGAGRVSVRDVNNAEVWVQLISADVPSTTTRIVGPQPFRVVVDLQQITAQIGIQGQAFP
jgi:hypothetical protein